MREATQGDERHKEQFNIPQILMIYIKECILKIE